jgi:hypothetical protein
MAASRNGRCPKLTKIRGGFDRHMRAARATGGIPGGLFMSVQLSKTSAIQPNVSQESRE